MNLVKDKILKLRAEGKTYNEIQKELGCSKGTISYYCGEGQKEKAHKRLRHSRRTFRDNLKLENGGKCCKCEYNRCLDALDFHHIDPSEKEFVVSELISNGGYAKVREEVKKCILLCANCHREFHAGLFEIGPDSRFRAVS